MAQKINTIALIQKLLTVVIPKGGLCIDATCGRGNDTAFLARLVGETGKVLAFDIQAEAIESTEALLIERGLLAQTELHLSSHVHLLDYVQEGTVDGIMFNLGYLPGGDHHLATKAESSILAIEAGLKALKPTGILTLCIYHGGDSGFAEKEAILQYLKGLDYKRFTVVLTDFYNRPNYPPLAAVITLN